MITRKLFEKHLSVTGMEGTTVKLALQLLCDQKNLKHFGEKILIVDRHWESAIQFICLVDKWFDLFSSGVPFDRKSSQNVYGLILETKTKHCKT